MCMCSVSESALPLAGLLSVEENYLVLLQNGLQDRSISVEKWPLDHGVFPSESPFPLLLSVAESSLTVAGKHMLPMVQNVGFARAICLL